MKSVIVLGLAILFVVQSNVEAKMSLTQVTNMLMPMRKTCIQKTGATAELVDAPKTGPMPDTPELRCYYSCLMKMIKVITKEGLPNVEAIVKQMDMMLPADDTTARLKDVLRSCLPQVTSTDPCEANWQLMKCFYETADKSLCFLP